MLSTSLAMILDQCCLKLRSMHSRHHCCWMEFKRRISKVDEYKIIIAITSLAMILRQWWLKIRSMHRSHYCCWMKFKRRIRKVEECKRIKMKSSRTLHSFNSPATTANLGRICIIAYIDTIFALSTTVTICHSTSSSCSRRTRHSRTRCGRTRHGRTRRGRTRRSRTLSTFQCTNGIGCSGLFIWNTLTRKCSDKNCVENK